MTYDQLAEHVQEINLLAALAGSDGITNYKPGERHDVTGTFAPFLQMPAPSRSDVPLVQLGEAIRAVGSSSSSSDGFKPGARNSFANPVLTWMRGVEMTLHDWTGDAAEAFLDKFVLPFPAYNHNQQLLLFVLREALRAEQEIWRLAQQDIDRIAEQTIAALDEMTPCPAFSRSAWPVTFTVIAAVILLSLEVAPAEITGGGILGTPSAIVASLEKAVARLTKAIAAEREKIATSLQQASQALSQNRAIVELPSPQGIHGLRCDRLLRLREP